MTEPVEATAFEHLCRQLIAPRTLAGYTIGRTGVGIWFAENETELRTSSSPFWGQAAADIAAGFADPQTSIAELERRVYSAIYGNAYLDTGRHTVAIGAGWISHYGTQRPLIGAAADSVHLAESYLARLGRGRPKPPPAPPATDAEIDAAWLEADSEIKKTLAAL